jgi:hypothetical protein
MNPHLTPSEFIGTAWSTFKAYYPTESNSLNGKFFEDLIACSLVRANVMPFYPQAIVTYVLGVKYDCILYTQEIGPVSLSAKVSMRERWKQADLEALALKNVHRRARSYLLSLNVAELRTRKADEGSVLALDGFILASDSEYDQLLEHIRNSYTIIESPRELAVRTPPITTHNCSAYYS